MLRTATQYEGSTADTRRRTRGAVLTRCGRVLSTRVLHECNTCTACPPGPCVACGVLHHLQPEQQLVCPGMGCPSFHSLHLPRSILGRGAQRGPGPAIAHPRGGPRGRSRGVAVYGNCRRPRGDRRPRRWIGAVGAARKVGIAVVFRGVLTTRCPRQPPKGGPQGGKKSRRRLLAVSGASAPGSDAAQNGDEVALVQGEV